MNSAALQMLVNKGFTAQEMVEFTSLLEAERKPTKAAERQARYRENKRLRVTNDVTSDATSDVTPPLKENSKPLSSEAEASGGMAADPVKELFDIGVSILTGSGQTEKQARSLIGKWRKDHADGEVVAALIDCRARAISNPVEWLTKRFTGSGYVSATGFRYRGDDRAVMREAEKRADWSTYYAAKANLEERAA